MGGDDGAPSDEDPLQVAEFEITRFILSIKKISRQGRCAGSEALGVCWIRWGGNTCMDASDKLITVAGSGGMLAGVFGSLPHFALATSDAQVWRTILPMYFNNGN